MYVNVISFCLKEVIYQQPLLEVITDLICLLRADTSVALNAHTILFHHVPSLSLSLSVSLSVSICVYLSVSVHVCVSLSLTQKHAYIYAYMHA